MHLVQYGYSPTGHVLKTSLRACRDQIWALQVGTVKRYDGYRFETPHGDPGREVQALHRGTETEPIRLLRRSTFYLKFERTP